MALPQRTHQRRRGRRAAVLLAVAGLTLTALPAVNADASAPGHSQGASRPWDAYNLSPSSRTVTPVRVTRTTGSVSSPSGVLHGSATTLTGPDSSITLDFGKEVGGLATVRFTGDNTAGRQLGLAFSESSQYIGTTSDASNGGSGSDGAIQADVTPGGAWTMPQSSLRGGFRYLTLFGTSDGPVSVSGVSLAISFAPTQANLRSYDNYFYSSDPLLNRIWYAGAYTVQTNEIAPDHRASVGTTGQRLEQLRNRRHRRHGAGRRRQARPYGVARRPGGVGAHRVRLLGRPHPDPQRADNALPAPGRVRRTALRRTAGQLLRLGHLPPVDPDRHRELLPVLARQSVAGLGMVALQAGAGLLPRQGPGGRSDVGHRHRTTGRAPTRAGRTSRPTGCFIRPW